MHHGVTVWAKRLHVFDRVNILGAAQGMQRDFMMYMDKASTKFTIDIPKAHSAGLACWAVMIEAGFSV